MPGELPLITSHKQVIHIAANGELENVRGAQFQKPNGVLADEANAIFRNGVLEIIMGMRGNG